MNKTAITVRWIVRILSVLLILYFGYFIVTESGNSAYQSSITRAANNRVGYACLLLGLVGLVKTAMNKTATVRCIARILSVLLILFFGSYMVADIFSSADQSQITRQITHTASYRVTYAMMLLSLVGLAVAWRWELIGSIVSLTAIVVLAIIIPATVGGSGMLRLITALLIVGLAVAWRWKLIGGIAPLTAIVISTIIIPLTVGGGGAELLLPITALLFVVCWWMTRRSSHKKNVA